MTEYNRTAVIAHLSQPTSTHQEGWGQPGKSNLDSTLEIDLDRNRKLMLGLLCRLPVSMLGYIFLRFNFAGRLISWGKRDSIRRDLFQGTHKGHVYRHS
jgi:hypothetical protein